MKKGDDLILLGWTLENLKILNGDMASTFANNEG